MKCDPGWHFNQLVETKELIETANVLGIVLSRLLRGCYCEIIVCVSEKNNFFALLKPDFHSENSQRNISREVFSREIFSLFNFHSCELFLQNLV